MEWLLLHSTQKWLESTSLLTQNRSGELHLCYYFLHVIQPEVFNWLCQQLIYYSVLNQLYLIYYISQLIYYISQLIYYISQLYYYSVLTYYTVLQVLTASKLNYSPSTHSSVSAHSLPLTLTDTHTVPQCPSITLTDTHTSVPIHYPHPH